MLEATNAEQRKALVAGYRSRELNEKAQAAKHGGVLAFDTPLVDALDRYLAHVTSAVEVRDQAPRAQRGVGLSANTARAVNYSVGRFRAWVVAHRPSVTTGQLDAPTLGRWVQTLTGAAATRNKHLHNVRTAINWLARARPPLFPDAPALRAAFGSAREGGLTAQAEAPTPECYSPTVLHALLTTAIEREQGKYLVPVTRLKGGKVEQFVQTAGAEPAVPLSRLVLLLALTGARRSEVLGLRWADCDLARGRITLHSTKTGRRRLLPLTDAPEGTVAPRLLSLLGQWRLEAGACPWVLPHDGDQAPVWPETAWRGLCRAAEVEVRPQGLRQTFCAVAASMGVPASVAALWQGHGGAVAEKWYRSAALERVQGAADFEEALGIADVLDLLLGRRTQGVQVDTGPATTSVQPRRQRGAGA